jgi:hypothetical protein
MDGTGVLSVGPDGAWIAAVVYSDRTPADHVQSYADARLIAAAPTLLAFHDAWVESQIADATGSPDLARAKREALIDRHKAVGAAIARATA